MMGDYDNYIEASGERVKRSRLNNPGRDAKYQERRIETALEAKTFHCDVCDIPCGTKQRLSDHQKTAKHLRKSLEHLDHVECEPLISGLTCLYLDFAVFSHLLDTFILVINLLVVLIFHNGKIDHGPEEQIDSEIPA